MSLMDLHFLSVETLIYLLTAFAGFYLVNKEFRLSDSFFKRQAFRDALQLRDRRKNIEKKKPPEENGLLL